MITHMRFRAYLGDPSHWYSCLLVKGSGVLQQGLVKSLKAKTKTHSESRDICDMVTYLP